jgi:hypothetical protein
MPRQTRLKRVINQTGERFREGVEDAKERFSDIEDSTVSYIKKNPIKSVAIAAGAGALIGAVLFMGIESMVKSRMRKPSVWEKYNPLNFF